MSGDLAGSKQSSKPSARALVVKVGWFAYWSAVAAIFAWATWLRFRLPLDPIAVPDYLLPALGKLIGTEFGYISQERTIIYPGFVYLVLRVFGDFRAITVIQHLLGLLAGGMLLLTWGQIRDFIPSAHLPHPIHRCLGLLAAAIYLFSGEPLRFEMSIRPEGISGFLIGMNLYFLVQFAAYCFLEGRPAATVAYGIAVVFSSILLASVKPSFWLTAIVALAPVAAFFFRKGWLRQKILLGSGIAVSAALLLLPEHLLTGNKGRSECFLPTQLFVIHANLIRDQMADDLKRNAKVPYSREWLERVRDTLSEEITKSVAAWPQHYATLGLDPDYLMYKRSSIVARLDKEFGTNVPALCAFYWYCYWRIWLHRPLLVVQKIRGQMAIFYASKCPAYRLGKFLSLTGEYKRSVTDLSDKADRKVWMAYRPAVDAMRRTELLVRGAPVIEQPAYIRKPLGILAITYSPLLLVSLALSAAVFLNKEIRRRLGWLAGMVIFTYSYNAANCLEVAIVHSLNNPRYLTVQMFFVILAQFLATLLILEAVLESRALISGKSSRPSGRVS